MKKSELIEAVSESANHTKRETEVFLDQLCVEITKALKSGKSINLVGVGKLETASRSERTGRNPQTGEPITIKAAILPKFKAAKALKDALNNDV